jgi:hypothetical protein
MEFTLFSRKVNPAGGTLVNSTGGSLEMMLGMSPREPLPRHLISSLAKGLGVNRWTIWRDTRRFRKRAVAGSILETPVWRPSGCAGWGNSPTG